MSYSAELTQSTLGFTALPFPQLLQNFQKQLAKTVEEKKNKQSNFYCQRHIK